MPCVRDHRRAFGVTSLLRGFAPNVAVLILGRALQGLSGGAMLICRVAILSHQFREGRERARAFGTSGLVLGFGPVGLTSTPVTNTTTGSVASSRSGMASGIDMSARLVTLAINISVMGILLATWILDSQRDRLAGRLSGQQVSDVAAHVANGDSPATLRNAFPQLTLLDPTGSLVPAALAQGFGLVSLYGGIAVWVLATASVVVFGVFHRSTVSSEVADSEAPTDQGCSQPR